jgi:hypothetical protein
MFSRTAVLLAMRALPYVRTGGGILSARQTLSPALVVLAALAAIVSAVLLPVPILAAVLSLVVFWRVAWNKIEIGRASCRERVYSYV